MFGSSAKHEQQVAAARAAYELPPQAVIPAERGYRYVQANDEILPVARPVKEIKERYARLIAQVALRTIHEVFAADPAG